MGNGLAPPGANAFDFRNIDIPGSVDGSVLVKTGGIWLALPPGTPGDFLGIDGGGLPAYTTIAGGGDMLAATYDPSGVAASAFNLANMSIAAEAQGDTYFRGVAGWERLPSPGTSGFVLTGAPGANPFWAAPSGDMTATVYDPTGVVASAFDLANFAIVAEAPGDLYTRGPGLWGRLAAGTVRQVLTVDVASGLPTWAENQLPTEYVNGCGISAVIVAGLTIGTGSVRDSTDVIDIVVTAPVVLVMPTDLDTGAEAADTWYDVYVTRASAGTIGGIFVLQGNAPTVPDGTFRRVGTVRNDSGSDFIPYLQSGAGRERSYLYTSLRTTRLVLLGGTATTPTITAVDCSAFVPPTTQVGLLGFANNSTTRLMTLFQDVAGPPIALLDEEDTAASLFPTNATQQIAYTNTAGGGTANSDISVGGYNESI